MDIEHQAMTETGLTNAKKLAAEIDKQLAALPDQKTNTLRALRRDYSRQLKALEPGAMIELGLELLNYPGFEHRFMAYELIHFHRPALRSLDQGQLIQLGRGLDSWWSVDTFGLFLAGPAWREHQVADGLIHGWAAAPDLWWRRTALVCTVALNNKARGGSGDTVRTLEVCRLLLEDREDMVVKAMSWALRELTKHDPVAVRQFMADYDKVLAPRVRWEVNNKLKTGLKNPRKG